MKKQYLWIGLAVAIVILGGGMWWATKSTPAVAPVSNPQANSAPVTPVPIPTTPTNATSTPAVAPITPVPIPTTGAGAQPTQYVVTYSGNGFSPNALTVPKGATVVFKNESSKGMWPASAMHPTHIVYSGTSLSEHCPDPQNTAFDACTSIPVGRQWSFRFDKTGTWGYHDHLNPSYFGKIVVQ